MVNVVQIKVLNALSNPTCTGLFRQVIIPKDLARSVTKSFSIVIDCAPDKDYFSPGGHF